MTIIEAMKARHSVRGFRKMQIPAEIREDMNALAEKINEETGLAIDIIYDDRGGFDSRLARYGKFENVVNYIVLAGDKDEDIDELCGYYGEQLVLHAQQLGLNTCWVGLTFNKKLVKQLIRPDQKLVAVIALGYGLTQGSPHKSKSIDQVVVTKGEMPDWFKAGVEAALLAPTAMNQQKFVIGTIEGEPAMEVVGRGPYRYVDLGIVKYHFEKASGRKVL